MLSRLERYKRENARMKGMLAYLLSENQLQRGIISETDRMEEKMMEIARDLACASALLQLQDA